MTARASSSSVRHRRRVVLVTAALAVLIAVVGAAALATGSFRASPAEVVAALLGGGDARTRLIVVDMRLPRVLTAVLIGAALAVAGAIFQTLSRNPLGSPDLVGFSSGSATGALVSLVVLAPTAHPALGAWVGGIGALLLLLAVARGAALATDRTILIGVALAALFAAVNDYLLTRAPLEIARSAQLWLHGSLTAVKADDVAVMSVACLILFFAVAVLHRPLRMMELGTDAARSLGVRTGVVQIALVVVALGLTGVSASIAGPIGFVALAAPQIARRLAGGAGIPLVVSAVTGALLLVGADLLAQRLLAPLQIPVGLVTGALGGAYLFWLVARARPRPRRPSSIPRDC